MTSRSKKSILNRILNESGQRDLFNFLSEKLSPADLQSLLINIFEKRSNQIELKNVFKQYRENPFVKPSGISPKKFNAFESLAYSLLPADYELIELSPVNPFGSCSVLAPVNQNNILTTIRNTEVNSDVSNTLAFECALRRQKNLNSQTLKFCTSHRLLRTMPVAGEDSVAHFKVLSLCAAGKDSGSFQFELQNLKEQVHYYIRLLRHLKSVDIIIHNIRFFFLLYDERFRKYLRKLLDEFLQEFPDIIFQTQIAEEKQNYYSLLRYQIFASNKTAKEYFVCDGGFTDWTQKLLQNKKERYLISGLGIERILLVF